MVVKQERMEADPAALQLSRGRPPVTAFTEAERQKQVQLWEIKDLGLSRSYGQSFRGVRSEESWEESHLRGGAKPRESRQSQCCGAPAAAWTAMARR